MTQPRHAETTSPADALRTLRLLWAGLLAYTLLVFVTYARVDPSELYHVHGSGLSGGLSRAALMLCLPLALVGVVSALFFLDRALSFRPLSLVGRWHRRAVFAAVIVAFILGWWAPFTVDQDDLTVGASNITGALAVGAMLALLAVPLPARTALARVRAGAARPMRSRARVALTLAVLLMLLVSLPWVAADFGFYLSDAPLLGRIFVAERLVQGETAVHPGHHHGMDGVLLVLSFLVMLPLTARLAHTGVRALARFLACLGVTYGSYNVLQDFWHEQVWKRSADGFDFANRLYPSLSAEWGAMVLFAALLFVLLSRASRERRSDGL